MDKRDIAAERQINAIKRRQRQAASAADAVKKRRERRVSVGLKSREVAVTPALSDFTKELDFLIKNITEAYEIEVRNNASLADPAVVSGAIQYIIQKLGLDEFCTKRTAQMQEHLGPNQVQSLVKNLLITGAKSRNKTA